MYEGTGPRPVRTVSKGNSLLSQCESCVVGTHVVCPGRVRGTGGKGSTAHTNLTNGRHECTGRIAGRTLTLTSISPNPHGNNLTVLRRLHMGSMGDTAPMAVHPVLTVHSMRAGGTNGTVRTVVYTMYILQVFVLGPRGRCGRHGPTDPVFLVFFADRTSCIYSPDSGTYGRASLKCVELDV